MITIFSAPKPFSGHIGTIQRNAIRSWVALALDVEVLLVGDEHGLAETAESLGVRHLTGIARNEYGTPLLSSIFALAHQAASWPVLCYINADIILLDDFLPSIRRVQERLGRFLIVGQRWDLQIEDELQFRNGWIAALQKRIVERAERHPPAGSDYFVFPASEFPQLPRFALGRAGWDNWMIFAARRRGIPVVDASPAITAIHQNHDYAHLPGGEPHYRLPESSENLAIAGGRETVFTLKDATWTLHAAGLKANFLGQAGFRRNVEAELIARLGPGRPARAVRRFFKWLDPQE